MQQRPERYKAVLLGLAAVLLATTLGGCFLFFPKKPSVSGGTAQPGRIEGRLVDEAGRAVVGATAFVPEAGQVTAISGSDGKFSLAGLAPGTWYVRVNKEGYLTGSFGVTVEGALAAQFVGQLALTAGNLHKGGTPNLCADCHVLHNPTPANHLLTGPTSNSACFAAACHAAGGAGPALDEPTYRNSPHGPAWTYNSNTQQAWTGQPTSERGNCNTCHEPHGISGPPFMLKKGIKDADGTLHLNDVCFECHSNPGTGNTAGWPGKTAYTDVLNLHVNPGAVPPSTLRTYPGLKYAMGDCGNCHVPHGQKFGAVDDPHMLRDEGYKLCLKCHTDKVSTNGSGHNGNCTVCHDPHKVTKTGGLLNVKDPAAPASPAPASRSGYRWQTFYDNAYCQKCHKTPAPNGVSPTPRYPYAATTGFRNSAPQGYQTDVNLHGVHVLRPYGSSGGSHYATAGDNNKVWCAQCHLVHARAGGTMTNPAFLTSNVRPYSGGTYIKNGCGVTAGCHTCNWCHTPPGNPGASCACSYHGSSGHSGVDYWKTIAY